MGSGEWGVGKRNFHSPCLAEMVAVQRINDNPEQTIFGIVSIAPRVNVRTFLCSET